MADMNFAARARLIRLRGADDAGAGHLSFFFLSALRGRQLADSLSEFLTSTAPAAALEAGSAPGKEVW